MEEREGNLIFLGVTFRKNKNTSFRFDHDVCAVVSGLYPFCLVRGLGTDKYTNK